MMFRTLCKIVLSAGLLGAAGAAAQVACGTPKLICLIPTALHTTTSTFNFFNEAFGTQVAQLPLATPASGFIFTLDKPRGVYVASQESFGPLLAERAETIGKHHLYLAFTYQRFNFSRIDGNSMDNLPILFFFPAPDTATVVTSTTNRLDTTVDQFVAFGTYGLTDRIDISVAVPFERISMGLRSSGTEYSTTTDATSSFTESIVGAARGVGDVVVSAKATALRREKFGIAVGTELRFPSGDEENFLGSGAFGVKPYVVLSRRGRVAPHLNLIYQWNGNSLLARDQNGEHHLPAYFGYAIGADVGVKKRLTVLAELLSQHFFEAPQISTPKTLTPKVNNSPMPFPSVLPVGGGYDVHNLGLGLKLNPTRNLLVSANVLISLDEGGVRAKAVPLVGLSYSF